MLEELVNLESSLFDQIEEGKIVREKPWSVRREEYESFRFGATLQHLLHACHQLAVLRVIEKQIRQDQNVKLVFTAWQARDDFVGLSTPKVTLGLDVACLGKKGAVIDVPLQILHKFSVRIIRNDNVLRAVNSTDKTRQAGTSTKLENCFAVNERARIAF